MKWLNLLLICVVVFLSNACERHAVSELAQIEESKEGAGEKSDKKSETQTGKPAGAAESPSKFFPDSK